MMAKIITSSANGKLNEEERLELARLLLKAGYKVVLGKYKSEGKSTAIPFIEYSSEVD